MKSAKAFAVTFLWLAAGCRQKEAPPSTHVPKLESARMPENKLNLPPDTKLPDGFGKLSPDAQRDWLRGVWRRPLEKAQTLKDRAELVRATPPGFRPSGKKRDLKLTLTPFSTRLKPGESLWYRLELQNIGTSSVAWSESNSFFKDGINLGSEFIHIYLTLPSGKEVRGMAIPLNFGHCPGIPEPRKPIEAAGVSEEDFKDKLTKATANSDLAAGLELVLAPGETLSTRPWNYKNPCFPKDLDGRGRAALSRGFREWPWDMNHTAPGSYGIRFEFSQPAPSAPPTEDEMVAFERKYGLSRADQLYSFAQRTKNSLGTYSSNGVRVLISP